MKHAMPVVLALLCFTTAADAIIYHSSLLVHPQSGKRALLLDDAHAQWIEKFGSTADKLGHKDLYIEQKKQLNQFGDHLLGLDVQKGSQLVVLTETPDNSYGCMVEQELGAVAVKDYGETLEVLPRMFLRSLTATAQTLDGKVQLLKRAIGSFNSIADSFAFKLDNGLLWVLGDQRRTRLDRYLSFTVYEQWQHIVSALDERQSVIWKIKNYLGWTRNVAQDEVVPNTDIVPTIDYVKNYLDELHAELEKYGIVDPYYPRLSQFLKNELDAGHIVGTDHIAQLYAYLAGHNRLGSLNGFNADMLAFVSLKCDVEFRDYAELFNNDPTQRYMIVIAGGVHNLDMKTVLESKGYIVDQELGSSRDPDSDVDISAILEAASKKPLKLLDNMFDF